MMSPGRQERLVQAIKNVLERGNYDVRQSYGSSRYSFQMTAIYDVEFYSLRWEIFSDPALLPFNEVSVNSRSEFVTADTSRQIAEISAEYAVMYKLGT